MTFFGAQPHANLALFSVRIKPDTLQTVAKIELRKDQDPPNHIHPQVVGLQNHQASAYPSKSPLKKCPFFLIVVHSYPVWPFSYRFSSFLSFFLSCLLACLLACCLSVCLPFFLELELVLFSTNSGSSTK